MTISLLFETWPIILPVQTAVWLTHLANVTPSDAMYRDTRGDINKGRTGKLFAIPSLEIPEELATMWRGGRQPGTPEKRGRTTGKYNNTGDHAVYFVQNREVLYSVGSTQVGK
jgi:hypothetical protein